MLELLVSTSGEGFWEHGLELAVQWLKKKPRLLRVRWMLPDEV